EASGEVGGASSASTLDLVAASRSGLSHLHHLHQQQQHQNHHQATSASAASSPNRRASPATPAAGSHLSAAATPRPPRARRRPASNHNGLDAPQVKTERLTPDNNSTSSRSVTPSSVVAAGHPGTPPNVAGESGAAATTPNSQAHHLKHMEQMMGRNYSDFMRSLAAKYNNSNPNEYLSSTRNGFHSPVLGTSAFKSSTGGSTSAATAAAAAAAFAAGLQMPAGAAPITLAAGKDCKTLPELALSGGGAGLFGTAVGATAVQVATAASSASLFPPMLDMSSTQALLHMVRTANAASNAAELESYLKGANKREPALTTPLDLSSPSALGPQRKRARTSEPLQPMINSISNSISLSQPRRPGSVSPRPGKSLSSSPTAQMTTTSTTTTTSGPGSSPGGSSSASPPPVRCPSLCAHPPCGSDAKPITGWSVDDVVSYVSSIDICAEYAQIKIEILLAIDKVLGKFIIGSRSNLELLQEIPVVFKRVMCLAHWEYW
ncbi:hypothetical protein QAD02_001062, partial [Eretmocerus hayati]